MASAMTSKGPLRLRRLVQAESAVRNGQRREDDGGAAQQEGRGCHVEGPPDDDEADPDGEEGGDDQLADGEGLLVLLDVA